MQIKTLLRGALFLASLVTAHAASLNFTVDTSLLGAGNWALQFQMTNGSAGAVNSAVLSNFNFGGGSAAGGATLQGGASGSLASGVTLNDTPAFLALFTESFTPGSTLTFNLTTTENFTANPPDFFGMAILSNGTPIPTSHLADQLIAISFENPLNITTFDGQGLRGNTLIPAPTFTTGASGVPEPSTYLTVLLPLAWLVNRRRTR